MGNSIAHRTYATLLQYRTCAASANPADLTKYGLYPGEYCEQQVNLECAKDKFGTVWQLLKYNLPIT